MVSLLMRRLKLQRVLVFTHSTESVHRLHLVKYSNMRVMEIVQ